MRVLQRLLSMPFYDRQRKLARERPPLTKEEFISRVEIAGGDIEAATALYGKLEEWVVADEFTPYPEDSLLTVYGIAEEELDEDIILQIFDKLKIPLPSPASIAAFGIVDTPISIARLASISRQR